MKHKVKAPLTPKICLIYRWVDERKERGPCRRKATKHNGLAWFCAECYKKFYGKNQLPTQPGAAMGDYGTHPCKESDNFMAKLKKKC